MMQVLSGGSEDPLNTTTTEYIHFYPTVTNSWTATESARRQLISGNGRITRLMAKLSSAPGGGGTYTINLRINAAGSGLTVPIVDTNSTGSDLTNIATIAAGDRIILESVPSGSPTNTPRLSWCAIYEDTDFYNKCAIIGGVNNTMGVVATEYNTVAGGKAWAIVAGGSISAEMVSAIAGTIYDNYVLLAAAPGAGTSYSMQPEVGGATIGLAVSIADANTSGNATGGSTAVSRGSLIRYRETPVNTPTARQAFWGVGFLTSNPHEFMLWGQSGDSFATNTTEYNRMNGVGQTWTTTETDRRCLLPQCSVHGLIVELGTAVTAGSITFTVYKNGSATALTATITSGTSGGNTSDEIYFDDFDEITIGYTSTSTLAGGANAAWAVACRKAFYSLPMIGAGI